eukprot:9077143-Pyramimonas_sp.AAC.1
MPEGGKKGRLRPPEGGVHGVPVLSHESSAGCVSVNFLEPTEGRPYSSPPPFATGLFENLGLNAGAVGGGAADAYADGFRPARRPLLKAVRRALAWAKSALMRSGPNPP